MDFGTGFGVGFGQPGTYASGPADGNYPGQGSANSPGMPNVFNNTTVVAVIVIGAIVMLFVGVISLRASGEVVI